MSGIPHGDASGIFRVVVLVIAFTLYSFLRCVMVNCCLRLSVLNIVLHEWVVVLMPVQIVGVSENTRHRKENSGNVDIIQVRSLEMKEFRKKKRTVVK